MKESEEKIRRLAQKYGINANPGPLDELARDINRLSDGDDSPPDEVCRLLMNLVRNEIISSKESMHLLHSYLAEKSK